MEIYMSGEIFALGRVKSDTEMSTAALEREAENGALLEIPQIYDTKNDRLQIAKDMEKMGLSMNKLANLAGINKSLLSEFFSNKKNISRVPLIRLFIVLQYDFKTVQRYLRRFKCGALYVKNRWDAIVINGINDNKDLMEIEADLNKYKDDKGEVLSLLDKRDR